MVDEADLVIAYVMYSWGGAAKTLEYAKRKKKTIINLAEKNLLINPTCTIRCTVNCRYKF